MTTPFPLLKLPQLPFIVYVQALHLWSLINLSVCSLRTRNSIKECRKEISVLAKPRSFMISCDGVRFFINLEDERTGERPTDIIQMNKTAVRIVRKQDNFWLIKCSAILDGWKLVMEHLMNTFHVSINLEIVGERHLYEYLTGHPKNPKIDELTVSSNFVDDVDMKFYLENFHNDELCFLSNQNKTFRFNGIFGSFKIFTCMPAEWITRENLLSLNCERIKLDQCSLTNEDLNMALKKWIDGRSPQLSVMEIGLRLEYIQIAKIMDGIEILKEASLQEQYVVYHRFDDLC
ncbi:hypothetical protein GCK72_022372 [Caenorhabditis remanei]|uniref:Sdz-33 F-box domain-containing protein n=1 Tax=Caenorhabditis remanei TaxID=31234 RepID=A0A6A5FTV9_CAERE|nr:hypothetical protein GCK72_022372 [Caenorhabditis remanei]KAF1745925.1 hypothetical protein GCK72_022372 [Caenorhabditis remanei]